MNVAVVLGTSKSDGNTRTLVDAFIAKSDADIFDLSLFKISFYDYLHKNNADDFLPLIHKLVTYDHLVFATPIYWYSMSAQLKFSLIDCQQPAAIVCRLDSSLFAASIY